MLLLAVAGGVAVANLYYAQPLAAQMATTFGVSSGAIGTALVATQIGYTLGMTLLVPLGDGRERRRVIIVTVVAAVPALLLLSAAPNVPVLAASSLVVGLVSSVPQMILPYAVNLLPNSE
ncbi:MAG TPA: MFS transporter, partial [Kofleriaceae bacterium]